MKWNLGLSKKSLEIIRIKNIKFKKSNQINITAINNNENYYYNLLLP